MVAFLAVLGLFIFTVSSYPVDLISTAGSVPWSSLVAALALQYSQSLHLHWSHYTHAWLVTNAQPVDSHSHSPFQDQPLLTRERFAGRLRLIEIELKLRLLAVRILTLQQCSGQQGRLLHSSQRSLMSTTITCFGSLDGNPS